MLLLESRWKGTVRGFRSATRNLSPALQPLLPRGASASTDEQKEQRIISLCLFSIDQVVGVITHTTDSPSNQ